MLELLSPAESPEAVIAAVQSGADAIYIRFGGSAAADFTEEDFFKAVRYCRIRACRVYVELNTQLRDDEFEALASLAARAAEAGVSTMVVHDLGLAAVLRAVVPDMALHAGERLGFHSLAGAAAAAQLGFSRVRLPLEMSLAEIAFIAGHASVAVEVAVQSATCFSRAGACMFSAFANGRSANRGDCSGLCREPYNMGGRMDDDNPLLLKDVCLVSRLRELADAGVACVRIGGCGGKPELTALLTGICSRSIREDRLPSPGELQEIDYAFSHRAFTEGYFTGERGDMFGAYPEPSGDARKVLLEARRGYEDSESRRVPVTFYAVVSAGCAVRIAAEDSDGNRAALTGPKPVPAKGRALTKKDIENALYKTGGTPFACSGVKVMLDDGLELPQDVLDTLRRSLLKEIAEKRSAPRKGRAGAFPPVPADKGFFGTQALIFQVLSADQLIPELAELHPDYLYVPLEVILSDVEQLLPFTEAGTVPVAVLPKIITDTETPKVADMLERARAVGVQEALVSSLDHIALCRRMGFGVRGDAGLNLFNSHALGVVADAGLLSATASAELSLEQIKMLCKPLSVEMIIYGRLPLMVSDHCIIKKSAGRCVCSAPANLSNNKGSVFPVVREFGCRNVVLSAAKLYLADRHEDYEFSGLWGRRLSFTTESARECVAVAKSCLGLSEYRPNGLTRGLSYRGVE
jgi:putative protease